MENGSAHFSDDMRYRYTLERGENPGALVFIMVNPSVATGDKDDPTIRKCKGFARTLGFKGFRVVNLFASIATDVKGLRHVTDPIGPLNDHYVKKALSEATLAIAAWGSLTKLSVDLQDRVGQLVLFSWVAGKQLHCLGKTQMGDPRHPLMTPYSTPLTEWPG